MDKHDAICWPSVVNTVINDALWPMSQWGSVNSRHWLTTGRRCGVRTLSIFGELTFVSLYCQTNSFRPQTAHAQPLFDEFTETCALRSENVRASLTVIGSGNPNDWTTLFSERAITWFDWTERPERLYRLRKWKIVFRLCSLLRHLSDADADSLDSGRNFVYLESADFFRPPPWIDRRELNVVLVDDCRVRDVYGKLGRLPWAFCENDCSIMRWICTTLWMINI